MKMPAMARSVSLTLAIAVMAACVSESGAQNAARDTSDSDTPPAVTRDPELAIVILDFSTSRAASDLGLALQFAKRIAEEASFGDQIVFLEAHRSGQTGSTAPVSSELPPAREPQRPSRGERRRLEEAKEAVLASLPTVFDSSRVGTVRGTDLLATVQTVQELVRERSASRTRLIFLSDMLQSAAGVDMERPEGIPGRDWIQARRRADAIPELPGVCVAAIGPETSTAHGRRVRDFWMTYFAATRADMRRGNYRHASTEPNSLHC